MVVGKPDININSYGIQYKEKKVNYTNKKRLTVTSEAEEARENTKWEKMNKPLKEGKKPNASQAIGTSPIKTQPFTEIKEEIQTISGKGGKQQDKKDQNEPDKFSHITQLATSSPPTKGHEDTTGTVERKPHAPRTPDIRSGEIVDLHEGYGRNQSQGEGLSTISTQEGGKTHLGMKPTVPKRGGSGGGGDQKDDLLARELREKHPTTPKGYTPPTKKELTNIRGTNKPSNIKDGKIIEGKQIPEKQKDPKGLRGQEGEEYTPQRLASIKSSAEETIFKAMSLKLDLMNKKDKWDKEEKVNDKKRVNHKNTWHVKPSGLSSDSKEVEDPPMSIEVANDEAFAGKDIKTGKITDEKKVIPKPRVGEHPSGKGGFIPSGLGLENRDTRYTHTGVTGNKKLSDKDRKYNMTPAMMTESYESAKLHKAADEIIIKLDLMKTTGKNTGDVSVPVTQVINQETGEVEENKPFPNKPVYTDDQGNNPNQNPTPVQGKGFKGRLMRRVNQETGKVEKVPKETTTKKIGNVPTKHKKGDIVPHNSPSLQETPENIRNQMDYLMHEAQIGGNLTNTKTQKELDEEHNSNEADKFAQTEAGKRIAAKIARANAKKKKLKKSLDDIIIKMNIMKLDNMKETEVQRIKKIPANTDEEKQQKRFALDDAIRSDNMAKPDKSLLHDDF